ncbi:MAG TPA: hypothetical protein VFN31_00825 [Candidatus Saccharimonadales bacterium]|nr:hypothetical protein [Candidatus Saccharimonadales bacterium]
MTNQPQPHNNEREDSANRDILLRRQEVIYAIDSIKYIAKGLNIDTTPSPRPEIVNTSTPTKKIRHDEVVFGKLMAQIEPREHNNQTGIETTVEQDSQNISLEEARNNVMYSLENPFKKEG